MQAHERQRPLDGLRGIAIALVVAYHAAPGVVPGGFVGVSVFFTLSGYLIGARLIDEWTATGRVDLVRFWSKRARRLLPAALVTIVVTAMVAYARGDFDRALGRAGLAAATYQQNWYQLSRSGGYGALFDRASPLDHYWSLAIEEQFYIVFPIALVLLLAACRGSRRAVGSVLVVAALASFLAPAMLGMSFERSYLGTDTRIGEIVVGVAIALGGAALLDRSKWPARAALPAIATVVAIAFAVPYGSGFFALGFLPVTVLTCCAMAGALRERTVVARALSVRPLVSLGVLSYSLYLVHWPLLTLVDGGGAWSRVAAVLAALAISIALHHAIERPGMTVIPLGGRSLTAGVVATALVAAGFVIVAPGKERDVLAEIQAAADEIGVDGPYVDAAPAGLVPVGLDQQPVRGVDLTFTASVDTTSAPPPIQPAPVLTDTHGAAPPPVPPTTTVALPPRLGFVGDSIALTLGLAVRNWRQPGLYREAPWAVEIGCGLARFRTGTSQSCGDPVDRIAALRPDSIDVAVVISCQWELIARKLPGEDRKRDITDPVFQEHVYDEYLRVADALVDLGVDTILWGKCAPMSEEVLPNSYPAHLRASREPERQRALADVVSRVAAAHPAVHVLDLGQLVLGRVDDPVLRPDGNHFEWETDVGVAADLDELIRCLLPAGCERFE